MGTQTQHKACPQVGRPNTTQGTFAICAPQRMSAMQTQGTSATQGTSSHPQIGCPNATQGTFARWVPKRNTRHIRKLGAPMQSKAHPQVGRPNARPQCKRKARPHVRKLGAPTQRKARPQDGLPNAKLICNENVHTREHLAKRRAGGWIRTNFGLEVDFLIRPHQGWGPQCNARHIRKMGAQTQHKARPQVGRLNATQGTSASWAPQRTSARHVRNARHVRTSAIWAPQRNARHVRKMVAQTQNSSATKTSTQGSTRLKDELEDG
jgi:hypothetical protein